MASCATRRGGVMGDTGGRPGDRDRDRDCDCERSASRASLLGVVSVGEPDDMFVGEGMVRAGMLQRARRALRVQLDGDLKAGRSR